MFTIQTMLLRLVFCLLTFIIAPLHALTDGRVALVIGNADYDNVSFLPNAALDARDVSGALRALGFDVIDGFDLTQSQILGRAQEFQRLLRPGDVAVFYFSGHGIQIGSENFIIPVDAYGNTAQTVRGSSVSLQTTLAEMEQKADRNIIILDA